MRRLAIGVVAVAVLSAACGDGASDEPITHPSSPDEVVLQIRSSGGGPPPPGFLESIRGLPALTVYGDGTAIRGDGDHEDALRSLEQATITEAGMQLMLHDAADAGMLDGDVFYDHPGLADFDSLGFTISADGITSRVGVYAPGESGAPEQGKRDEVITYREQFYDLAAWMGAEMTAFAPRATDRVLVVVIPSLDPPFTYGEPEYRDWAWGNLADPATFTGSYSGEPCFVLSGDALDAVRPDLATATRDTVWQSSGRDWQVVVRPLLPHEPGCE